MADALVAQWTRVIGTNATNQVQLGYSGFGFKNANLTTWSHHWRAADGINTGSPRITFTGFSTRSFGKVGEICFSIMSLRPA